MRHVLVVGMLVACNVDGPKPDEPTPPPPKPIAHEAEPPAPPPPPIPIVDRTVADGFEVRAPITSGRLALYPIVAPRADQLATGVKFLSFPEGMATKLVSVTEVSDEDWDVDWVRVTNKSAMPLAIIGGELIIDGKQDRSLAEDVVIAAHKSRLVPVRCVEEKREDGGVVFHDGKAVLELSLRKTLLFRSQDDVWEHVGQINRRNGLAPPTRTYRHSAALQSKKLNAERHAKLIEELNKREDHAMMVGYAVAIDGKLVALERFATPELYRDLEPVLLASYLPQSSGKATVVTPPLAPADIRAYATKRAKKTAASTVIIGT